MEQTDDSLRSKVMMKIRMASDLPAMAETVTIVNKFKSSEDTSISELANVLLKDYAMTTKILKVVNSVHYSQSAQVTTISRAIFLMGIEQIKNIALTLMLFEQLQKNSSQTEIMDAIIQAYCSGVIARKIVADLNDVEEEEAFICALLHPLGKIIIAHTMPEKLAEIRGVAAEQDISEERASASVLGISFEELGTTIATEWNYPQKIVKSMCHTSAGNVGADAEESWKLGAVATLSNEMSNVLASDAERNEKEGKLKGLLASFSADPLPLKNKNIEKLVSTSAQDFKQLATILNLNLQKSKFSRKLDQWSEESEPSAPETEVFSFKTESLKTVDTLFAAEEENPESIFSKGIQEINTAMLGPYALNDVIRIALETIFRGMNTAQASRVLFFVRDVKRPQMEIRIGFGSDVKEAKQWFIIPVTDPEQVKDIFNLSISKDNDLIIKDTEAHDIKKYFPPWYRDNMPATGYLVLFPVSLNKKNIGLISIEGSRAGFPSITRGHLNYLRILRDQTVMAMRQSSR
ncbi:MAG: HDOD domain-containing protein [Smithellaceae bacterium]|nr:HDOD domain-containing protein [Smithellaceae bacterium]